MQQSDAEFIHKNVCSIYAHHDWSFAKSSVTQRSNEIASVTEFIGVLLSPFEPASLIFYVRAIYRRRHRRVRAPSVCVANKNLIAQPPVHNSASLLGPLYARVFLLVPLLLAPARAHLYLRISLPFYTCRLFLTFDVSSLSLFLSLTSSRI